jgi:hypothetical protein
VTDGPVRRAAPEPARVWRLLPRAEVLRVLRNAGLVHEADELAPELPETVDIDRNHEVFERYGIDRDVLVSRMGGSS